MACYLFCWFCPSSRLLRQSAPDRIHNTHILCVHYINIAYHIIYRKRPGRGKKPETNVFIFFFSIFARLTREAIIRVIIIIYGEWVLLHTDVRCTHGDFGPLFLVFHRISRMIKREKTTYYVRCVHEIHVSDDVRATATARGGRGENTKLISATGVVIALIVHRRDWGAK